MAHKKIIYRLTDKRIPAVTGLGLVGDILDRADFLKTFRGVHIEKKRSKKHIDTGAVMATFIALLCMGEPDFECVRELQNDAAYYQTLFISARDFHQKRHCVKEWTRSAISFGICCFCSTPICF